MSGGPQPQPEHGPDKSQQPGPERPGDRLAPRLQTVRPAGLWRRPVEADVVSDRLGVLVHELAGLVEGSTRQVALLLRSRVEAQVSRAEDDLGEQRLRTLLAALERMAEAIRHASGAAPSAWLQASYSASLADAVQYGAGILEPLASERGVRLEVSVDPSLAGVAPGHMYTVVVNAVRNALESIGQRRAGNLRGVSVPEAGRIDVRAQLEQRKGRGWVRLEVHDTGAGPPTEATDRRVFEPGFSTKAGGLGVGLALARQIVEQSGGTIELLAAGGPAWAPGAVLRVLFPADAVSEQNDTRPLIG